ncbi:hypothetical protein [Vibrio chagasii]|uniref:hypothetical protein n=1 Tax=Vibrio chagasii TaxID=170679 RepID=UPI003D9FCA97
MNQQSAAVKVLEADTVRGLESTIDSQSILSLKMSVLPLASTLHQASNVTRFAAFNAREK